MPRRNFTTGYGLADVPVAIQKVNVYQQTDFVVIAQSTSQL